jgi:hypothetical protein
MHGHQNIKYLSAHFVYHLASRFSLRSARKEMLFLLASIHKGIHEIQQYSL